jgi:hypothetical protein
VGHSYLIEIIKDLPQEVLALPARRACPDDSEQQLRVTMCKKFDAQVLEKGQ